jgi:hypothetical protein
MDRWMEECMDGWRSGRMDVEKMDVWRDGWVVRWMGERRN